MRCPRTLCLIVASPLAFALPVSAAAQSIWLEPHDDAAIQLEILKPDAERFDLTFASSAFFLSLRLTAGPVQTIVVEVPVAYAEEETFGESDATLGNPYIGAEFKLSDSESFAELGVRFPLTDHGLAAEVGAVSDLVDRLEAFLDDVVSIHAGFNHRQAYSGLSVRIRGAPVLDIPTEEGNPDLFLLYSAQVWYTLDTINLGGGVGGRIVVTERDVNFGERTVHQLALAGSVQLGRFRPGVQLRLPLDDDLRTLVDQVVSFSLAFRLR